MTHRVVAVLVLLLAAVAHAQPPAGEEVPTGDPRAVVGAPRAARLTGAALEAKTEEVAALLRCPVCQGLSVADSPATMARNMKARVRELLAEGYDREQVLAYFERSYGEFVRLQPPLRGVNWIVWVGPAVGLAVGVVIVGLALRRPRPAAGPPPDALPDDPALAAAVRRVRELAYGWPGGIPPAGGA